MLNTLFFVGEIIYSKEKAHNVEERNVKRLELLINILHRRIHIYKKGEKHVFLQ